MGFLSFQDYSLWINAAVFAASAAVVWLAGTRVSGYADTISERTGLGQAFTGLLLLGGITSLPEVAVGVSAGIQGNAALAVNNMLGGVAMQVAILAIADAAIRRDALTSVIVQPIVLLQGSFDILLLTVVAAGIVVGDVSLLGVGGWAWGVLALYIASVWLVGRYQGHPTWRPAGWERAAEDGGERSRTEGRSRAPSEGRGRAGGDEPSLRPTILKTIAAGLAILVAGYLLSRTGEAIAHQTGLGSSFVGAVFVAISTSLPEVSTVLAAVRLHRYEMAVSDILGTNLFDIGLIFVIDAVYAGGPVLNEVGRFSSFGALLGIAVTTLYIAGLVERRDRTVLRMGVDSLAVLGVYAGGLVILYSLR